MANSEKLRNFYADPKVDHSSHYLSCTSPRAYLCLYRQHRTLIMGLFFGFLLALYRHKSHLLCVFVEAYTSLAAAASAAANKPLMNVKFHLFL
jgi:hypothetical protein